MPVFQPTRQALQRQWRQQLALMAIDRMAPPVAIPPHLPRPSAARLWPNLPRPVRLTVFNRCTAKDRAALARYWITMAPTPGHDLQAQALTPNWYVVTLPAGWHGTLTIPPTVAHYWPILWVRVGRGAKVIITEPRTSAGGLSVYLIAEPQSEVHWHSAHTPAASGQWFGAARLGRQSTCQWTVLDSRSHTTTATRTITNYHGGSGARGTIVGLVTATGASRSLATLTNTHATPHTSGDVVWRVSAGGAARITTTGWVRITASAPQTKSFLDQRAVVRAGTAVVRSIPNLIIDSADVIASHRATVGPLDQTAKWFLTSRGLSPARAERVLIRGFASELIPHITEPTIADEFRRAIGIL